MSFSRSNLGYYGRAERLLSGSDFKRKSLKRTVIRDTSFTVVGRFGSRHQVIVKDRRGRDELRYLTDEQLVALSS